MKTRQMSSTLRKSRMETAEPSPISVRLTVCRYARIETDSVFSAPAVMMKMLSKIRKASTARNRTATMIAPCMLGRVTRRKRCHHVAPSTIAACWRRSGI